MEQNFLPCICREKYEVFRDGTIKQKHLLFKITELQLKLILRTGGSTFLSVVLPKEKSDFKNVLGKLLG